MAARPFTPRTYKVHTIRSRRFDASALARMVSPETRNQLCRTRMGWAWQFHGHCKTQYASLHGWEHFRRCHVAVIDLLASLPPLGCDVKISDEGDYWPCRNVRALRAEVEGMNLVIAAGAGAMKDAFGDDGGVEAPIFAHAQFERLEAEGAELLAKRSGA